MVPRTSIHNLDDDSLLGIFYLSRPSPSEENERGQTSWGNWDRERWWYTFVHVCRRWRCLIFGSASHLRLCLVCGPGTPVADMLANSPPFPLIIYHNYLNHHLTAEDEEGILLALQHRDRVCRIGLDMPVASVQRVITAIDGEFPVLEFLHIRASTKHNTQLILPATLEAPHLRHLALYRLASPIGSRLLPTATGLVRLLLRWIHPSVYPHPEHLLQLLLLLPQLEGLEIGFSSPVPNRDLERQLLETPTITYTTLPNLHFFVFWGVNAYLEALLPHMATPHLEWLSFQFSNQLTFSVPHLLQFMTTTENLRFSNARFIFHHRAVSVVFFSVGSGMPPPFAVDVTCGHLDWQVSSMAQIFNILSPLLSAVVDLSLVYGEHTLSSEGHNQADRTQWRKLLGSFRNVKTLRVHQGLVAAVSQSLRLDGEPPLELLPELNELICPQGSLDDKVFDAFINEREVARQPINLIEEAFPVGHIDLMYEALSGMVYFSTDTIPVP
jgi:hypothetical protein